MHSQLTCGFFCFAGSKYFHFKYSDERQTQHSLKESFYGFQFSCGFEKES
jgi:hypothetical protein